METLPLRTGGGNLARRHYRRRRWPGWGSVAVLLAVGLTAYYLGLNMKPVPEKHAPPTVVNLVDPRQELITAGAPGWEYRRTLYADLDGDNSVETIEILARVLRAPKGSDDYQWDDGQPWQVYVQDGGEITHVYARYVQLGRLEVFVTDETPSRLAIAEAQGAGYALYYVEYTGPRRITAKEIANLPVRDRAW